MRRLLLLPILLLTVLTGLQAQEDPEYRLEVGGMLGLVSYLGDFNGSPLSNQQPMAALVAKYRPNPRSAVALSIGYGQLKGSSADVETWYPQIDHETMTWTFDPNDPRASRLRWDFSNQLIDVALGYEYNFWAFGTGQEYRGARRVTPYISLGLGATYVKATKGQLAMQVPIGLGVKVKLATRLNLTAEWKMHITGSDQLDGVSDPYGIRSSGLFKNTDCYSALQLMLTYDLWAKCKTCNNDRY